MREQHTPSYLQLIARTEALMPQNEWFRMQLLMQQTLNANLLAHLRALDPMGFDSRLYDMPFVFSHLWRNIAEVEGIDLSLAPDSMELFGWTLRASKLLKPRYVLFDVRKHIELHQAQFSIGFSWHALMDTSTFLSLSESFRNHHVVHTINGDLAVIYFEIFDGTSSRQSYLLVYRHGNVIYHVGLSADLVSSYAVLAVRHMDDPQGGYFHIATGQQRLTSASPDEEATRKAQMHLLMQRRWEQHMDLTLEPLAPVLR
ncbi:hypothetical protein Ae201684P_020112 [Aphanomyces euteiches]|nr:hypothetical protein Ae201684P_020112 [Aphanomyces euteiches]